MEGGGKGCAVIAAAAGVFSLLLGLVLLFALASGGGGGAGGAGGLGGTLDTSKIEAQYVPWVEEAGTKCGAVSAPLIAAQTEQESGFNPNAVSSTGAEGTDQFEPDTWKTWGIDANNDGSASAWDAADNIVTAGIYDCALAKLVAKVPGDPTSNMLAAYNAGPKAVLDYDGVPPYPQTQDYVKNILKMIPDYTKALPSGAASGSDAFAAAEVAIAEKQVGLPYVWGGGADFGPTLGLSNPQNPGLPGFDCSGLVLYAAYQASHGKVQLPHSSEQDATLGQSIALADIEPGDAVAIQMHPKSNPGDFDHIVIYAGGGEVVAAATFGEGVKLQPLADFNGLPMTVRRFG
jgi:cell wall-associated NlpC family hydrolase